jgi:HEAT repeat protein
MVISALGSIKDPRAVDPLIALFKIPDDSFPWETVSALSEIGDRGRMRRLNTAFEYRGSFAKTMSLTQSATTLQRHRGTIV